MGSHRAVSEPIALIKEFAETVAHYIPAAFIRGNSTDLPCVFVTVNLYPSISAFHLDNTGLPHKFLAQRDTP